MITMKAPVGPPIWTLLPPSREMMNPAIIAVIIVAIGIGFYMCNDTYQVEEIQEAVMI